MQHSQVATTNLVASRIDHQIEQVKRLTEQADIVRERLMRHARSLGFEPPSAEKGGAGLAPTPVITTLSDALAGLERAMDHLYGSLNVFD